MFSILRAVANFYFDLDGIEANIVMTAEWVHR